jgi:hypothetical protein
MSRDFSEDSCFDFFFFLIETCDKDYGEEFVELNSYLTIGILNTLKNSRLSLDLL